MNTQTMALEAMNNVAMAAGIFLAVMVVVTILWVISVTRDINK